MQRVIDLLRQYQNPPEKTTAEGMREDLDKLGEMNPAPEDVKAEPVDVNGVEAEWVSAPNARPDRIILYLHGGGFIAGSINTHRNLASKIARSGKARALVTDYRLAPENPFPAQLEDTFTAYKWLISEKQIKPESIIISGDSAGGNLAISVLVKIRDEGLPLPAAAICLSPVTDLTASGESMKSRAEKDPMITPEAIELMINSYLDGTDPKNPLASPLYADLSGLPPIFIQAGTSEVLLDDSTRIAQKLESEGVETEIDIWEDMIHVFATFADIAPESKQAIEKIGNFIEKIYARHTSPVKEF